MAPDRPVISPELPADRLEVWCDTGPYPEAGEWQCAALCVGGRYARSAAVDYAGEGVEIVALVDWPSGLAKPTLRQIAAVAAAKDGVNAVTLVAHPPDVVEGRWEALRDDLIGVVSAGREVNASLIVRVAVEVDRLAAREDHVAQLCRTLRESGVDGLVTSTAFPGPQGSDQRDRAVRLAKQHGESLQIIALAGVWDRLPPEHWLNCGADRVAVSAGILS